MKRIYTKLIRSHLKSYRQMVFIPGPRQSGKTTIAKEVVDGDYSYQYLNWDYADDREVILSGIEKIYQNFKPDVLTESGNIPVVIFDEIHKYSDWKNLLKGYFDVISDRCKIIVTGSAKLNVYRHGGDSMMGRYFLYRVYPLSVAEINQRNIFNTEIGLPTKIDEQQWQNLITYGGFPEPFLKATKQFYTRWSKLKREQLYREDLRDISQIHDVSRIELLGNLLAAQVCSTVKNSELAKKIRVTEPTIRSWISVLERTYYCFGISPWSTNISRSLLKDRKYYLWDWSLVNDPGARIENIVACHLKKAVDFWTDIGLGNYGLFYLRDKDQKEVDFLIVKDNQPWIMIEVKSSDNGRLSKNLLHFSRQINVKHVFQCVADMPYIDKDIFALKKAMIVPLKTLLSQLV